MRSPRAGEKRSDPGLRHLSLQDVAHALGGEARGKHTIRHLCGTATSIDTFREPSYDTRFKPGHPISQVRINT